MKNILLVAAGIILGIIITNYYFETNKNSDEKAKVISEMIELRASLAGGINRVEMSDHTKKFNILIITYKLAESPSEYEIKNLEDIATFMNTAINVWDIDTKGCFYPKGREECISDISEKFYFMDYLQINTFYDENKDKRATLSLNNATLDEYSLNMWNLYKDKSKDLVENMVPMVFEKLSSKIDNYLNIYAKR